MNGESGPIGTASTDTAGKRESAPNRSAWVGPLSLRDGVRLIRLERRIAKIERRVARMERRVDEFLAGDAR